MRMCLTLFPHPSSHKLHLQVMLALKKGLTRDSPLTLNSPDYEL